MEGKGEKSLNKEFDFRACHCGKARGGTLNKDLEFRSCIGRQGGEV